jgi:hypothetical protein
MYLAGIWQNANRTHHVMILVTENVTVVKNEEAWIEKYLLSSGFNGRMFRPGAVAVSGGES